MKLILIFLAAFAASSCLNSFLTSQLHDDVTFMNDLVEPHSIVIRIVIAGLLTQYVMRVLDKKKNSKI
jgi:hypothetical protein